MITSKDNNKIKYIRKLRTNKFMNEEKCFIVEGQHLIREAAETGILKETFSVDVDMDYGVLNTPITLDVMKSISTLPSASYILGICRFVKEKKFLGNKIIILDGVRDPGNLGTIIRSAKAFNVDTIVLSLDSVNKYNEKVIRAAQGMLFKVNVINRNLNTFIPYLVNDGYNVYGTNVSEGKDIKDVNKTGKIAVVMGSEGNGVTDEVSSLLKENIYIKMNSDCESLNVAIATSIIMYELAKGE